MALRGQSKIFSRPFHPRPGSLFGPLGAEAPHEGSRAVTPASVSTEGGRRVGSVCVQAYSLSLSWRTLLQ